MKKLLVRLAASALVALPLLSGCTSIANYIGFGDDEEKAAASAKKVDESAQSLAQKGMNEYQLGRYFNAVDYFDKILNQYPFSPEATLAELKSADCKFFMGRYADALGQYKDFEDHHPTNEAMSYVLFQKGMCNYLRIDRVDRDTSYASEAIKQFKQLLRQFPDSPYAPEAEARVKAAQDFLAQHEFFVAEYYLRRGKLPESQGRLKYLLTLYPDCTLAPRAKELLTQLEAGKAPKTSFLSSLSKIALPDWMLFRKKKSEPQAQEPAAKETQAQQPQAQ
ncbi:MAG: outer membrane protein assembly factor BamD [Desulfobulbaceae bacterium]|jgi:outer membrane protein assembly factor BamD|nr:outer membrane protein assembly factor BamD [Desulfobulbaceae bacterium]